MHVCMYVQAVGEGVGGVVGGQGVITYLTAQDITKRIDEYNTLTNGIKLMPLVRIALSCCFMCVLCCTSQLSYHPPVIWGCVI